MEVSSIEALKSEQCQIDKKVADYSLLLLKPLFVKRRDIVKELPRFWAVVVGETEPLRPYITFEDSLAFDALEDVFITYDEHDSRTFDILFTFGDNPHFPAQSLKKRMVWNEKGDYDGYYTSPEATEISWKEDSNLITQHLHGEDESFFTWFAYTSTDNEEDTEENSTIAQLLRDELYPAAIDFYEAAQDDQDVAEDYDISDE